MVQETKTTEKTKDNKASNEHDNILEVKNLKQYFPITSGILLQRHVSDVKAVDDISFTIRRGETLGLVGESGCGKSTTGRSILQLNDPTEGEVIFNGENIANWNVNQMRPLRRQMQLIFQMYFYDLISI